MRERLRPWFPIFGMMTFLACCFSVLNTYACDTPVYRYAMYRWQPAPFELYVFHAGELSAQQQKLSDAIDALGNDLKRPTNLVFYPVDLAKDSGLLSLPADVRESYKAAKEKPTCMLISPQGVTVYAGNVTADDVEPIIDSPARRAIAKNLAEGHATVMLVLGGVTKNDSGAAADEDKTKAAVAIVNELVEKVNTGKLELYKTPASPQTETTAAPEQPAHQISMLQVDRTDPQEKWFVKMLMTSEDDLHQFDSPMVFPVYGRGRALPAFLDKGISVETMADYAVVFLTGACSCTVKEQNPGFDLLMRTDWDSVAAAVADKFGAEEGNEFKFDAEDFFPDILIPTEDVAAETTTAGQPTSAAVAIDETNAPTTDPTDPQSKPIPAPPAETDTTSVNNAPQRNSADNSEQPAEPEDQVALNAADSQSHGAAEIKSTVTFSPIAIVGTAVGVAFLLLMGMTLMMTRGRG